LYSRERIASNIPATQFERAFPSEKQQLFLSHSGFCGGVNHPVLRRNGTNYSVVSGHGHPSRRHSRTDNQPTRCRINARFDSLSPETEKAMPRKIAVLRPTAAPTTTCAKNLARYKIQELKA